MAKLPPLNALRAFESAARHGGFIGASEELHVTRGAISRHVKLLEEHLGIPLFVRQAQGVRLTAAGKRLLPVLTESFGKIAREAQLISSDASDLRIICPPATSIRWLLPKLGDFRRLHPEFRVRLTTDFHSDFGFDSAEYDVGFSVENWPNRARHIETLTLFPVLLTPACAPCYLRDNPITSPHALASCELLHETSAHADWRAWIGAFAPRGTDPAMGQDFPNLDMAAKAAVMGMGVVMADLVLCRDELEAGTLIAPLRDLVCDFPSGGICLIGAHDTSTTPKVEAFKAWAYDAARSDRDAAPRPGSDGPEAESGSGSAAPAR